MLVLATATALSVQALVLSPFPQQAPRASPWQSRAGRVLCGWGPDPVFASLNIKTIADAADGLKAITVEASDETATGFLKGGQYVQLREPGAEKAAFIAIASAPATGSTFEVRFSCSTANIRSGPLT